MASTIKLSIDRYLAACVRIEETVGAIYRHWGQLAEFDEEIKTLWRQMEIEEREHVCQVEMLRRLARGATIGTCTLSDEKVLEMVEFANNCLAKIKARPMLVHETLALAIQLENLFKDFHATQAVDCLDAEMGKLFKNLSRNDAEHVQRLKMIYRELFFDIESVPEHSSMAGVAEHYTD